MFKFGKKQQSAIKREAINRLPVASDLRSLLASAQRNAQKSIELAFYTADSPVKMTLVVNCEQHGKETAFWSLYRTDVPGLPPLWTQQSSAIDLVQNLVELGYSTAVESQKNEIAAVANQAAAPVAQAQAPSEMNESDHSTTAQLSWSDETENSFLHVSGNFPTLAASLSEPLHSPSVNPSYLEPSHGFSLSADDGFAQASVTKPAATDSPEVRTTTTAASPQFTNAASPVENNRANSFNVPPAGPMELEQALAISKQRKQQALTEVIERLTAEESIACRTEIIKAVRLVINPFDPGGASPVATKIDSELRTLTGLFGEQEVAIALTETFKQILDGHSAPYVSAIDEVTSRWFF
ncbi:MAG: hypothetical protein K2W95_29625 [Candidatus Obscuribacterales bacterium]|nr:hypothetical protein [Candidatus Obscuribacterales bacterium]